MLEEIIVQYWGVALLVLGLLIAIMMSLRVIVPPEFVDVVLKGKSRKIYSSAKQINPNQKSIYYRIPGFIPLFGMYVKRMPLKVIEISVNNYETFAQQNARFICDVSVYGKVNDPQVAAERWPGSSIAGFQEGIKEIIVAAIRNTTTKFPVEDVIAKKQDIADGIQESLDEDMKVYGFDVTNVAVVGISDPESERTTVIRDISAKMEAEINSASRKQIAIRQKEAEIVEAESTEKSQIRKREAEQKIGEAEQEKQRAIYLIQQSAQEESMKVERIKNVRLAEITKESAIIEAEGQRLSVIRRKEGEAQGLEKVGLAEAAVIKARGLAEAEAQEKMADALNRFNEVARTIRGIEKEERVGMAGMSALKEADMTLISTGELKSFVDLFSAKGGANFGGMLKSIEKTNPGAMNTLKGLLGSILQGNSSSAPVQDELNDDLESEAGDELGK